MYHKGEFSVHTLNTFFQHVQIESLKWAFSMFCGCFDCDIHSENLQVFLVMNFCLR